MDAPVVVNPDIVSKNASSTRGIAPLSKNGNIPTAEKIIHVSVTMREPSLLPIVELAFRPEISNAMPVIDAMSVDSRK